MTERNTLPVLMLGIDDAWQRLWNRIDGLGTDEYLWEPAEGCWSVHPVDGRWQATCPTSTPSPHR
jgi:hypothetical protein